MVHGWCQASSCVDNVVDIDEIMDGISGYTGQLYMTDATEPPILQMTISPAHI